jgi:choline dehydrogenase
MLQLESFATKVLFDTAQKVPRAIGVEYIQGAGVYSATWQYDEAMTANGTLKCAFARREIIVSGGTFNSPQLLQLSGIGNATHLRSLGIPVIADIPGVGLNLRDNQELPVAGLSPVNITTNLTDPLWAECTFGAEGDPCLALWEQGRGPYTYSPGNTECSFLKTEHSLDETRDVITFS